VEAHTSPARKVLIALDSREESAALQRILVGDNWRLHFAGAFPETEAALRASSFGIVICSRRYQDGHGWKDLLNGIQAMPIPPQLIVADRLADDALWAEVLNLGGYDLLMTPFEAEEVLRVVPMAWDFRERELERANPRSKPAKAAQREKPHAVFAGTD
jgi:DNA-binding NtrC family response regulator